MLQRILEHICFYYLINVDQIKSKPIMAIKFDSISLEEKIKSGQPIVADFWAEWCGPCRMLGPIIDELKVDYIGKAIVGKLNVDDHQETAIKYGVRSIPTVLFFNKGELVEKFTGIAEKKVFEEKINALLNE